MWILYAIYAYYTVHASVVHGVYYAWRVAFIICKFSPPPGTKSHPDFLPPLTIIYTMPTSSALHATAVQIDGGVRSFPITRDAAIQRDYGYQAPNIDYEKLFHFQAARASQSTAARSAGWLIPDDRSCCNPVFIAHSLLSAIWLLRETLPEGSLDDDGWQKLVSAGVALAADDLNSVPPSAQRAAATIDSDNEPGGPPLKRKAPPSPIPTPSWSPKRGRRGTLTPRPGPSTQEQSPVQSPEAPEPSPVHITTVTNNNRRAEQTREKKRAAAVERKRQSLGLEEPANSAEPAEKIAYRTIAPADDPDIAWIIKQPVGKDCDFYTKTKSPYRTACSMLAKARAIGSQPTWYNVATFLQAWRERGTPVPSRNTAIDGAVSSQMARRAHSANGCDGVFQQAWHMSHYCEQQMATVMIEYRWAMALLGRAYANKVGRIQQNNPSSSRGRDGRGAVKSEAIDSLLLLVHPASTSEERKPFVRRLNRATRWYQAAETLGWGSLCLMPTDVVSTNWVEKDVLAHEWSIWLNLIQRVNKDACAASIALDNWLGAEGIQGGPIQGKEMLCIEQKGAPVVCEVEEIADSADEEGSDSDFECTSRSVKSASRPLRQLTLLELFKPQ